MCETIFTKCISNIGFESTIYTYIYQYISYKSVIKSKKTTTTKFQNGQKNWIVTSQKKTYKWPIRSWNGFNIISHWGNSNINQNFIEKKERKSYNTRGWKRWVVTRPLLLCLGKYKTPWKSSGSFLWT